MPGDPDLGSVLVLMQGAFAYMDGRVDPPSSIHRMTAETLSRHAAEGEIWAIGTPPVAAFILTPGPDSLYIGKLAVATSARGKGLARRLTDLAEERARALNLPWLELQTRIELIDNHATFVALGFSVIGETAHPGYAQPTSLTFRRPVSPPPRQQQDRQAQR
ncbi:GNAT family N-acetyltransferase [Frigidibacter sp. ROC022]|uniref:GNAT family N-acetyltransferase n=1 Tax=Frigidibacter sp. ROC022 TaxID=2971796 RepID=UPI00215A73F1|nr:GNAT family N-acetyltransferase [Frigidibacter sp. ROC022]MCR8724826.1 GNAT family N-acetyltransferase [Frigidibacter sp. ROC022]